MDANFAKDALQARILGEIFRDAVRGSLAVKGGMAMRAAYGSVRHTKDIDLSADAETMSLERVRGAVGSAIRAALRRAAFVTDAKVTEPKMTDVTQRWKISATVGGTPIHLTVECSRRDRLPKGSLRTVKWQAEGAGESVLLDVYHANYMAASKVACLCSPLRDAPRDVFDLALLIELRVQPPTELVRRIGRQGIEKGLQALWDKIEGMSWERAKAELLPFMPEAAKLACDEDTWDATRLRVGETVSAWLADALRDMPPGEMRR